MVQTLCRMKHIFLGHWNDWRLYFIMSENFLNVYQKCNFLANIERKKYSCYTLLLIVLSNDKIKNYAG